MTDAVEQNRRAWDEVHRRRSHAMAGQLGIPGFVRERLPDLRGRRVLHLQCASGEETSELARLGAHVTGVDISAEALAVARDRGPGLKWVQADVHALPPELGRGEFDLVYTGGGVKAWLHDLDAWAAGISAALRPGGELLDWEEHPVYQCLDSELRWAEDYFEEGVLVNVGWEHFELTGEPAVEEKHERFWRLGQILTALAGAGLVLRSIEELPPQHSWRRDAPEDSRIPGEVVIRAVRP